MLNFNVRYAKWPALIAAIATLRAARIALDLERNPLTIYNLVKARSAERRIRKSLASELRQHSEALASDREHRRRYASLYARRSRTLDPAATLRHERKAARAAAALHASNKRANNLAGK